MFAFASTASSGASERSSAMTERTPMDTFETRLATLVRAYTEPAATPGDSLATARTAMASASRRGVLGQLWPVRPAPRLISLLLLAALIIALAALAVAVGSGPSPFVQVHDGPGRIVFVRDGDLFVAEGDGSGQTLIGSGGAADAKLGYLTAGWSPDMRYIAAVRDVGGPFLTPAVDLMTKDGALIRTVTLDPGCGPSLSWSPDSSEVAIATCPADVPRDTIEPVDSGIRLLIARLDGGDREIALPPDWQSVASANHEVWIRPELWAKWSPEGRWIAIPAIVAGQGGQYLVADDGSDTRRIEDFTDNLYIVHTFDWSPDGRGIAISGLLSACPEEVCLGIIESERGLVTATVAHPADHEAIVNGKLFWPEFSPAGDKVAVLGGLADVASEQAVTEVQNLYVYDRATARFTELTAGSRSLIVDANGAAQPTGAITGELVEGGSVAWTPDGRGLLYLVREAGDAAPSWTLRSIDAAGGIQSSILVRGIQSFDIGFSQ